MKDLKLTEKEVKMLLYAISCLEEYSHHWDTLYNNISKQTGILYVKKEE